MGQSNSSARFNNSSSDTLLRWTLLDFAGNHTGFLSYPTRVLSDTIPANEDTAATATRLRLSLRLPAGTPAQDYLAGLHWTARSLSGSQQPALDVPLLATSLAPPRWGRTSSWRARTARASSPSSRCR